MISPQKTLKHPVRDLFLVKMNSIPLSFLNRKTMVFFLLMTIFYFDFIIPQETAIDILYVFALILIEKESSKTVIYFTILTSILLLTEIIYHYLAELQYSFYGDRTLSFVAIWIASYKMLMVSKLNREKLLDQNEIAKQETKYSHLIDNLMEGAQIIDSSFKYIYINDISVKQSKYRKGDLLGFTMMEKYPGIENTEMFFALKDCLRSGKPKTLENEFTYPDGTKGWFQLSIQSIEEGLFILSKDVTELRKTQESLIKAHVVKEYTEQLKLYKEQNMQSLRYAQSIQKALMPSEIHFAKTMSRLKKQEIQSRNITIA
jgi:PAS domain S-box-containing protein